MKIFKYLAIPLLLLLAISAEAQDPVENKNFWVPFGNMVNDVVVDSAHNQLIIGGRFNYIGPTFNPNMASIEINTLEPDMMQHSPDGAVYEAIKDGEGGWYIGGAFTKIGQEQRYGLTHILPDGSVGNFAPSVKGGVRTMLLIDSMLYIGGSFTKVNGQLTENIAALNRYTGELVEWEGKIAGSVEVMNERNDTIYVGGSFVSANNYGHRIAQINAQTGIIDTRFPVVPSALVTKVLSDKRGGWFVAGLFSTVADHVRYGLAHFNANGELSDWDPNLPELKNSIGDLKLHKGKLYVVGDFSVSNDSLYRVSGLALDTATAEVTAWNPRYLGSVNAIEIVGDTVYAGGNFTSAGDWALNAYQTDSITGKNYGLVNDFDSTIETSISDGNSGWYVSGTFDKVNNRWKQYMEHIDSLGPIGNFNCVAEGVKAMALQNGILYLGGSFTKVNGEPAKYLAAVNAETGELLPVDFKVNAKVSCIKIAGDTLYASGSFSSLSNKPRARIGAINLATNEVLVWETGFSNDIEVMEIIDNKLYVGGFFEGIAAGTFGTVANKMTGELEYSGLMADAAISVSCPDGNEGWYIAGAFKMLKDLSRPGLGQINADGSIGAWSHAVNGKVNEIKVFGDTLIVVGEFTEVDGEVRNNFAAFSISNDILLPWAPSFNEQVQAIEKTGNRFFVAGWFDKVNGINRGHFAEFNYTTGALENWNPNFNNILSDIFIQSNTLYASGNFGTVSGQTRWSMASFNLSLDSINDWAPKFNGSTNKMGVYLDNIYVTGSFTQIDNVQAIYFAGFNMSTGQRIAIPGLPEVAIGTFNIDGHRLFYHPSAGTIRTYSFITNQIETLSPLNGYVSTISFNNTSVFLGGNFTGIGTERKNLAALDRSNGTLLDWDSSASSGVTNMVTDGENLYVSGEFGFMSDLPRYKFAVLNANTGAVLDYTIPIEEGYGNGEVSDMALDGDVLYLVGKGLRDSNRPHENTSVSYRISDFSLRPWRVNIFGSINTISAHGGKVFAGGSFTANNYRFGVGDVHFQNLTASNDQDGAVLDWSTRILAEVHSLKSDGERLFVGGSFIAINSESRKGLGAIDLATRAILPWNPDAKSKVKSMGISGDTLYVVGEFTTINGVGRNSIGALNTTTGELLDWNPQPNGVVRALHVDENAVYISGSFSEVQGIPRSIASLSKATAEVNDWHLKVYGGGGYVRAFDSFENQVFAVGSFDVITGTHRTNLAAFSKVDGELLDWNPSFNQVKCMEPTDMGLFVGGGGIQNESQPFALLDFSTGAEIPTGIHFQQNQSNSLHINAITLKDNHLYFGGAFSQINDQSRTNVGALNYPELTVNEWDVSFTQYPSDFAFKGDTIYISNAFAGIGTSIKSYLTSGETLPDSILYHAYGINKLEIQSNRLYAFGDFTSLGGVTRKNIAAIDLTTGRPNDFFIPNHPEVKSLAIYNSNLFIGTQATVWNPQPVELLAWNLNSNTFSTDWQPDFSNISINSMYGYQNRIYATTPNDYLTIDATTGQLLNNNLNIQSNTTFEGNNQVLMATGSYDLANPFRTFNLNTQEAMPWDFNVLGYINDIHFYEGYFYLGGSARHSFPPDSASIFRINAETGATDDYSAMYPMMYPYIPEKILRSGDKIFVSSYYSNTDVEDLGGFQYIDLNSETVSDWRLTSKPSTIREYNGVLALGYTSSGVHPLMQYYELSQCETSPICSDVTIYLDEEGTASISPEDIDNGSTSTCEITSLSLGIENFDCDHLGDNNIGLTLHTNDGYGFSCNALITVIDTISPVISASDFTVQIPLSGDLNLNTENLSGIATDNCAIDSIQILSGNTTYTCADQGNTFPIEVLVTDLSGNTATGMVNLTIGASMICCVAQASFAFSDTTICAGDIILVPIILEGGYLFEVVISDEVNLMTITSLSSGDNIALQPTETTVYTLVSVSNYECMGSVYNSTLTIYVTPAYAGTSTDTLICGSGDMLNLESLFAESISFEGEFYPESVIAGLPENSGTYYYVGDNGACGLDTATFNIEITDTVSIENVQVICEANPFFYRVSFDIAGGSPPYQVNGESWNNAFYESAPISVSDNPIVSFEISDHAGCPAQSITAEVQDEDNNGACDDAEITGCMNPIASNYNPLATIPGICSVEATSITFMEIIPNPSPSGTDMNVHTYSGKPQNGGTLIIYTIEGRKIREYPVVIKEGYTHIPILDSQTLAPGVYIAVTHTSKERITKRFVITR